jgi:hypothetical protein
MSPASGPVHEPKLHPAATMDDQEMVEAGEGSEIVLGPAPFSSPDPATDAQKMLPLSDGTSAYEARVEAQEGYQDGPEDYKSMKKDELVALAGERDVNVEGMKVDEIRAALAADDASDMKAADFKQQIADAADQDALDAVGELYEASGKSYSSVEDAMEKRQTEIDEAAGSGQQ